MDNMENIHLKNKNIGFSKMKKYENLLDLLYILILFKNIILKLNFFFYYIYKK
jgi:hypothetical protein